MQLSDFSHACPVCSGSLSRWREKRVGDTLFPIQRCDECGFALVNPRPSVASLAALYAVNGHGDQGFQGRTLEEVLAAERRYPNSSVDARRIVASLQRCRGQDGRGAAFLDVGCGYGFFSKAAVEQGFEVTAIEVATNERGIAAELAGVDAEDVSFEAFDPGSQRFDVILMSQILEHVHDVDLWVKKASRLLVKGGVLVVALPNFDSLFRRLMQEREVFICPPEHLNFFSSRSLELLLSRHGLDSLRCEWTTRIPNGALGRRLPGFFRPVSGAMDALTLLPSWVLDRLGLGMMLTMYARKSV